jgi:hypothetical protein
MYPEVLYNKLIRVFIILISTLNEDSGLSHLFWGVVVFRHHVIIGIEMLSKW